MEKMIHTCNRSVKPSHVVPPALRAAAAASSFTAVALALIGLPLVAPRDSHAQETTAHDEEIASISPGPSAYDASCFRNGHPTSTGGGERRGT